MYSFITMLPRYVHTVFYSTPVKESFLIEEQSGCITQCPEQIANLLENHPLTFAQLFGCLGLEDKKKVLRLLTFLENWNVLFMKVFQSLDPSKESMPQNQPAGQLITIAVQILFPPQNKKKWVEFCSVNFSCEEWAFFMLVLEDQERAWALSALTNRNGFSPYFEALAQQTGDPDSIKAILIKILRKFYRNKKIDQILSQLDQLTLRAQICLLDAMRPTKQEQVFDRNRNNLPLMASWMEGLFHYRCHFSIRLEIFQRIFNALKKDNFVKFLECLDTQNAKVGAYFLACLSSENFQKFVFEVPFDIRTRLLFNSPADATSYHLLMTITQSNSYQRQLIYESMGLNMANSVISIDPHPPYTLKRCCELLRVLILNPKQWRDISFIARIPPVLIGFLVLAYNKQLAVLVNLAKYLSEEQLKFVACVLSDEEFCNFAENVYPSLNKPRFLALLLGLSDAKILGYVKFKKQQLQNLCQNFADEYQEFQAELDEIQKGEEWIDWNYFTELENQARKLKKIIYRPSLKDYVYLDEFLGQSYIFKASFQEERVAFEQEVKEFEQARNRLSGKCPLFTGEYAYINIQLAELKQRILGEGEIEKIDLTMMLDEDLRAGVPECVLPYLDISFADLQRLTCAGQLAQFGIQNHQDLDLLGISQEELVCVEKTILEITQLKLPENGSAMEVDRNNLKIWQKYLDIQQTEENLQFFFEEILRDLHIEQVDSIKVKERCLSFCQSILAFKYLSKHDWAFLQQGKETLEAIQGDREAILLVFAEILQEGLLILRSQHPLFCWQRYLFENKNLKQIWQKLNLQNCFTIRDLAEKSLIQTPVDFLRLGEFANTRAGCFH